MADISAQTAHPLDLPVRVNGAPTTARQLIAEAHDRANGFADREETTGRPRPDPTAYECGWHEGTIEKLCAELHLAQARGTAAARRTR